VGYAVVAVVVGALVGLAAGGHPRHLTGHRFRAWPLLATGAVAQVTVGFVAGTAGVTLLLVSYAAIAAFAAANVRVPWMALVVAGLALNIVTIAVNEGMPVRRQAVVDAGIADRAEVSRLDVRGKHHLERPGDHLMVISDVIPVRPLRQVLSVGDVLMMFGVAGVVAVLLRRPRPRYDSRNGPRRPRRAGDGAPPDPRDQRRASGPQP
jgi:hypothetical protein